MRPGFGGRRSTEVLPISLGVRISDGVCEDKPRLPSLLTKKPNLISDVLETSLITKRFMNRLMNLFMSISGDVGYEKGGL